MSSEKPYANQVQFCKNLSRALQRKMPCRNSATDLTKWIGQAPRPNTCVISITLVLVDRVASFTQRWQSAWSADRFLSKELAVNREVYQYS